MSTVVLIALVSVAAAAQYALDRASLRAQLATSGRTLAGLAWVPWEGLLRGTRSHRYYRVRFRDERGRIGRARATVGGIFAARVDELDDVDSPLAFPQQAAPPGGAATYSRKPLPLPLRVATGAALGASAGAALGIVGAFVLYPGSNVAPAYGLILVTPVGLVVGTLTGLLLPRASHARPR